MTGTIPASIPEGTSAPDTMRPVAEQAKLLHRINRRSLFLTVQASIRCRCPALYLSSVLNFSEKHGMKHNLVGSAAAAQPAQQNRTVVRCLPGYRPCGPVPRYHGISSRGKIVSTCFRAVTTGYRPCGPVPRYHGIPSSEKPSPRDSAL